MRGCFWHLVGPTLQILQCGKDLIRIGEARGEARGLAKAILLLLRKRFKTGLVAAQSRVRSVNPALRGSRVAPQNEGRNYFLPPPLPPPRPGLEDVTSTS